MRQIRLDQMSDARGLRRRHKFWADHNHDENQRGKCTEYAGRTAPPPPVKRLDGRLDWRMSTLLEREVEQANHRHNAANPACPKNPWVCWLVLTRTALGPCASNQRHNRSRSRNRPTPRRCSELSTMP